MGYHGAAGKTWALKNVVGWFVDWLVGFRDPPFIHSDLNPASILLDDNLRAKIRAHNLERRVATMSVMGKTIVGGGSIGYTAPELMTPQTSSSQTSDIYSLGQILCDLLQGMGPCGPINPSRQYFTYALGEAFEGDEGAREAAIMSLMDPEAGRWPPAVAVGLGRVALESTIMTRKKRTESVDLILKVVSELRQTVRDNEEDQRLDQEEKAYICPISHVRIHAFLCSSSWTTLLLVEMPIVAINFNR